MSALRQMNTVSDIPLPTPSWLAAAQSPDDLFPVGRGEGAGSIAVDDTGLGGRFICESLNQLVPTRSWLAAPKRADDLFPVGRGESPRTIAVDDAGFQGRFICENLNRPLIGADSWSGTFVMQARHMPATLSDRPLSLIRQQVVPGVYGEPVTAYPVDQGYVTLFGESDDEDNALVAEFARGVSGFPPPAEGAVGIARSLVRIAASQIEEPEISVDIDGELSFDLRREDGHLVFAELSVDGRLDVGVYDENNDMVLHDTRATVTLFKRAVAGGSLS